MNNVFRAKFPSWEMILALSPRELAYEIALGMNAKMRQSPNINWSTNGLAEQIASGYANTPENRRIIMEGVQAMFALGLLTESGSREEPYVFLSRAGRSITSPEDPELHRARHQEAYALLDPSILERVWSTYLRGDFDIAISYAFKRVEVQMREKGGYGGDQFGERLIKRFFTEFRLPNAPDEPKATTRTPEEEFFIGTSTLYRNPATHQDNTIEHYGRAMEVLLIANHQLHLVRSAVRRS